jgi:hypothetical protein
VIFLCFLCFPIFAIYIASCRWGVHENTLDHETWPACRWGVDENTFDHETWPACRAAIEMNFEESNDVAFVYLSYL